MAAAWRSARSATRAARWRRSPPTRRAATSCRCATRSTCSVRNSPQRMSRHASSAFEQAVVDGWICWAFSNHDVVRHVSRWTGRAAIPTASPNSRSSCWFRCAARSASTRARSWGWRRPTSPSRICAIPTASASGRPSRAATAAARRWSGKAASRMPASRPASRGCRCPRRIAAARSTSQQGEPGFGACALSPGAGVPPRAPGAGRRHASNSSPPMAMCWPSSAATATSGCFASSTSPATRRNGSFPAELGQPQIVGRRRAWCAHRGHGRRARRAVVLLREDRLGEGGCSGLPINFICTRQRGYRFVTS